MGLNCSPPLANGGKQPRQLHQQPPTTTPTTTAAITATSSTTAAPTLTASATMAPNTLHNQQQQQTSSTSSSIQTSCPTFSPSAAFQQVKQTQASLARLTRIHQQQHQSQQSVGCVNQANQSSQQQLAKLSPDAGQQQPKQTTFVDCLIRRFKNCFDEDFCTVPMFVVGNLSPGSDGTHLILPPCVSLGRQHINRFSSPKNLRLMNSIRESCRSIEELDLGGNKLTDLIEVYKILQSMPNLKFLNLSENDLSRTSPVAMASLSTTANSSSATILPGNTNTNMIGFSSLTSANQQQQHCSFSSPSASGPFNQRACLAPLNQNQQQQTSAMSTRRHSSLGQQSSSSGRTSSSSQATTPVHLRARQTISRVAEARRMAAANALAQSKKTSSLVASKLTQSATASGSLARSRAGACRTSRNELDPSVKGVKQTPATANQRLQATQASTMHLARSLSSLSAKDIRASSSSINRLNSHRSSIRNETGARTLVNTNRRSSMGSTSRLGDGNERPASATQKQQLASAISSQEQDSGTIKQDSATHSDRGNASKITTSTSHQKLYAEPIAEHDDVDMAGGGGGGTVGTDQRQLSPSIPLSSNSSTTAAGSNQTGQSATTSASLTNQHQATTKATALQTTTGTSNALRSYCNNNGLVPTMSHQQSGNFRRTFESVKALALNNTGCQWKVVCSILSRMPNLEELHLSLNNYEKIDLDTNEFRHHSLKRLYLCNNPKLTNWEELDKLLIAFPSLEALSIADCNISQIPDNLDRAREWRKLCGLNINGWPIKEWPVVERLNQLPSLVDLKCRNLDVLSSIDEPRHHLIARLPKLQRLNGSEIEEREDAERAFLRFFMVNSHLERPARFHELMQVYGEVPQNIDVDVDLSPPSQARVRVIYLNRNHYCKADEDDVLMSEDFLLKLMDNIDANSHQAQGSTDPNSSQENMEVAEVAEQVGNSGPVRLFKDEGQEVMALEVDLRQSVRKFKTTIASLFGLESQNLILYYIDHEMVGLMGPELIKHNQKKLWNYNVQDGDQFIVENR